jgi:cytochrome c553
MMKRFLPLVFLLALLCPIVRAEEPSAADLEFFEKKVRPVLHTHCYSCHADGKQKGGLSLATREGLLKGGDSGPVVSPGQPEKSLLIEAIRQQSELKMPPKGKLSDTEIADLTAWVKRGVPWTAAVVSGGDTGIRTDGAVITAEERAFWSFQPISDPTPPAVKNDMWPKKPLDRFILAKLEEKGLRPVGPAGKRALLRRATFDLIGLPPTPEEIDAFLADDSPTAFAKVVDRLLESPHYGERWGRHWLDVARYGEDQAHTFQARLYPNGFRYRDWVVKALNDDMPYDRFVIEQIAGDLLKANDPKEHLPALGFFAVGPHYYNDAGEVGAAEAAELDDKIDTLTRGFLGLTVACARCHDHKFDPIPTADYYALAGVFKSTKYAEVPLGTTEEVERFNQAQERIRQQEAKVKQFLDEQAVRHAEAQAGETARYMVAAWKLQERRKTNPSLAVDEAAKQEKLRDTTLDRWRRYLFDKGSESRPKLADWRKALAGLEAAKDLSADPDAIAKIATAAKEYQDELQVVLRERDEKKETLDKDKAEWLKEIFSAQGVFRVEPKQVEGMLAAPAKETLTALRTEVEQLKKNAPKLPSVHTIAEGQPGDMHIYLRGNPTKEGDLVERHFPRILAGEKPPRFTEGSGRLELARAIASPKNPLTARVMVNRLWQHHFGKGLVGTPSNFGKLGQRPTHPELLDHLASKFIASGWSVKAMHREIMLSATYQLSCDRDERAMQVDGGDQLLWRMNRRRLDVEAWRDALLAVSGNLDRTLGGAPQDLASAGNKRRTLYGSVSRHNLNNLLRLFDFPDPNITSESRPVTIVALQQLFVLNSDFMMEQARALAKRLESDDKDDAGRIRKAFLVLYGRPATEREVKLGLEFLAALEPTGPKPTLSRWEQYAQVLLSTNEFAFVD